MTTQYPDGTIEFRFYRRDARRVSLVGDFTGWNTEGLPMQPCGDGWWVCRLCLNVGVYQFQYEVDGQRFLDFAAFGLERGPFGWNSVINVNDSDRHVATHAGRASIRVSRSGVASSVGPKPAWRSCVGPLSSQAAAQ